MNFKTIMLAGLFAVVSGCAVAEESTVWQKLFSAAKDAVSDIAQDREFVIGVKLATEMPLLLGGIACVVPSFYLAVAEVGNLFATEEMRERDEVLRYLNNHRWEIYKKVFCTQMVGTVMLGLSRMVGKGTPKTNVYHHNHHFSTRVTKPN